MILLLAGPPRLGDLNFIPRVFGKPRMAAERAVQAWSTQHAFQLRAHGWFWRQQQTDHAVVR